MSGTREPATNACDTFGRDEPTNLPCHVAVERERDGRFRVWVYFAGKGFAACDPTTIGGLALEKAYALRDCLAGSGANVSALVATPESVQ